MRASTRIRAGHPLTAPQAVVVLNPQATPTAPTTFSSAPASRPSTTPPSDSLRMPAIRSATPARPGAEPARPRRIKQDSRPISPPASMRRPEPGPPGRRRCPASRSGQPSDRPNARASSPTCRTRKSGRSSRRANALERARQRGAPGAYRRGIGSARRVRGHAIAALATVLGLPTRLRDLGVDRSCFAEVAKVSFAQGKHRTNPSNECAAKHSGDFGAAR